MVSADTLRRLPFFKWATEDSLQTLALVTEEVRFDSGQELFKDGEPAEFLYILTRGEVEIQYALASGERRTVETLGEAEMLVWSAVVEPYVHTAFGVARTSCEAVAVDAIRLRQVMAEDTDLANSLMTEIVGVIAQRLKGARAQLARSG